MTDSPHLTEAERHELAENALANDRAAAVAGHLEACEACTADVARIRGLMARVQESPKTLDAFDDVWPAIRERIEREKIVQLRAQPAPARPAFAGGAFRWATLAAAAAVVLVSAEVLRRRATNRETEALSRQNTTEATLSAVADSARSYEQQANFLLNELELRRALMRPQTAASVDHDLQVIDKAIAELKDAIARDPNNPALRRLLASSYKQKVDLLKRVGNAG